MLISVFHENVSGHKGVWAQPCVGTKVCGHKRVWAQTCVGTIVWAEVCMGTNVWSPFQFVFGSCMTGGRLELPRKPGQQLYL